MQIHEVTQPSILKTIGQDIKGAVTAPFQKAAAVLNTPGAMTDPHAYRDAMNQYRAGQVAKLEPQVQAKLGAQIDQKTQQRAKELAQDWIALVKSKKPRPRLKSAPTPITPTGQYATKPVPAGQVYGSNYPVRYRPPPPPPRQLGGPVSEQDDTIRGQVPGKPSAAEYEKLQQRIAAAGGAPAAPPPEPPKSEPAQATPSQPPKTGFAAVAGPTPPPGGKVPYTATTTPKNILTGSRAREFQTWANQQLTSRIPGTNTTIGLEQIKKFPEIRQNLNSALTRVIRSNNDPRAVEEYFLLAMRAMQNVSRNLKQSGQVQTTGLSRNPMAQGVLDRYVDPVTVQKLKDLATSPAYKEILKKELGIT